MNIFLKKITVIVFSISLILLLTLIFLQFDGIYSEKRKLFESEKAKSSVIIIGTSHSYWGIISNEMPYPTINIAEINKPLHIDLSVLENQLQNLNNLKYIIIPIDYFTLFYSGQNDPFSSRYYHHWNLRDQVKYFYPLNKSYFHLTTCGINFKEVFSIKDDINKGYLPKGENFNLLSENEKINSARIRIANWHKYWFNFDYTNKIVNRLISFTRKCSKKGVKIVYITMPVSRVMRNQEWSSVKKLNKIFLLRILNQTDATYLDLNIDTTFNSDSLFADCDHLNAKGAAIATKLISQQININK